MFNKIPSPASGVPGWDSDRQTEAPKYNWDRGWSRFSAGWLNLQCILFANGRSIGPSKGFQNVGFGRQPVWVERMDGHDLFGLELQPFDVVQENHSPND